MSQNDDHNLNKPQFDSLVHKALLEQQEYAAKSKQKKTKIFISPRIVLKLLGAVALLALIYRVSADQEYLSEQTALVKKNSGQRNQVRKNSLLRSTKGKTKNPKKHLAAKSLGQLAGDSGRWQSLVHCAANSPWFGYGSGELVKIADDFLIIAKDRSVVVFTPFYGGVEPVFKKSLWRVGLNKIGGVIGKDFTKYGQTIDLELPYRSKIRGALGGSFFVRYRQYRGVSIPLYQYGIVGSKFLSGRIQKFRRSDKFWPENETVSIDPSVESLLWGELSTQRDTFLKTPRREYRPLNLDSGQVISGLDQKKVVDQCLDAANAYQKERMYSFFQDEKKFIEEQKTTSYRRLSLEPLRDISNVDSTLVHRIIGYNMSRLQQCVGSSSKNLKPFKQAKLYLKIDTSGRVRSARYSRSHKIPRKISQCIARQVSRVRFYMAQKSVVEADVSLSFR